jgi:hypothetical protein
VPPPTFRAGPDQEAATDVSYLTRRRVLRLASPWLRCGRFCVRSQAPISSAGGPTPAYGVLRREHASISSFSPGITGTTQRSRGWSRGELQPRWWPLIGLPSGEHGGPDSGRHGVCRLSPAIAARRNEVRASASAEARVRPHRVVRVPQPSNSILITSPVLTKRPEVRSCSQVESRDGSSFDPTGACSYLAVHPKRPYHTPNPSDRATSGCERRATNTNHLISAHCPTPTTHSSSPDPHRSDERQRPAGNHGPTPECS